MGLVNKNNLIDEVNGRLDNYNIASKANIEASKISNRYETQGGAWAAPTYPLPKNGDMVVIYNSVSAASRLYIYSNAGWHFTALT